MSEYSTAKLQKTKLNTIITIGNLSETFIYSRNKTVNHCVKYLGEKKLYTRSCANVRFFSFKD